MSIKEVYDWYAKEGYLTAYPRGGLTVYNYTARTVYEGNWNYHTLTARGLVLDREGRVVARPWSKFFNLNERPETQLAALPTETPELADKFDGSLVIVFRNPETGTWQACTRGSWDNAQCGWANAWLERRRDRLDSAFTYLFELVAPWNRIVILYPEETLILLGVIHTESGEDWPYRRVREWGLAQGLDAVRFEARPLESVRLDDRSVVNQEGYVARFDNGFRVKLKYLQYLYLHKLVTGLSVKGIWELLSTGAPVDLTLVPDEFLGWFEVEKAKLVHRKRELEHRVKELFNETPNLPDRKSYAAHFARFDPPVRAMLFRMLDGRPYEDLLWKLVKPEEHRTFRKDES